MTGKEMNNLLFEKYADYEDGMPDPHGHGKRVPYIGWLWRDVDFDRNCIWVGNCGPFIGIIVNNKWDYNERMLTEAETIFVKQTLCTALSQEGDAQEKLFLELWEWFQHLPDIEWIEPYDEEE